MEFKSVAIIGAGAVGSYLIWGLSNKSDIDFCIVADGDRKDRLEKLGLIINGENYKPKVKTPQEASGVDLLIVTVKYNALENTISDIKKIVDSHTVIMSLMNGVDSEELIGKAVGKEKIIYSLIKIASERKDNSVKFNPRTTIGMIYGEKDLSFGDERIKALDKLFSDTGLHYRSSDVIEEEIWGKFLLNIGNNLIQAIASVGVGGYEDSEHLAFLKNKMREEVIAISKAKGIDLTLMNEKALVGTVVQPRARYSTLQDLDSKRHTEIDMFSGTVMRMGKELNIPTPYNEYTFHMIKALEEKNDGKFDY